MELYRFLGCTLELVRVDMDRPCARQYWCRHSLHHDFVITLWIIDRQDGWFRGDRRIRIPAQVNLLKGITVRLDIDYAWLFKTVISPCWGCIPTLCLMSLTASTKTLCRCSSPWLTTRKLHGYWPPDYAKLANWPDSKTVMAQLKDWLYDYN